jgi:Fic family protein
MNNLQLISIECLEQYIEDQPISLSKHFNKIKILGAKFMNLDFYFSNSAVYSSMIEGNRIDLDSYLKYSYSGMNTSGKSFQEIEDLKKSYLFAKDKDLTLSYFLECHAILSHTMIEDNKYRGIIRDKDVFVFSNGQKIYTGTNKDNVKSEMELFFSDIQQLINVELSIEQIFYFASMMHLILVQIHPFADGNGRSARLLEKLFLAQKLGESAWYIQTEKMYQKRITSYHKNVHLGEDYSMIKYRYALPFLMMLPMALRVK